MAKVNNFQLAPDKKGVVWDLLLYIPTVVFLTSIGLKMWYSVSDQSWAYVLFFAASFFFLTGANRIASRMMLLPSAPAALEVAKQSVALVMRSGERIELVKELRYYADSAGKSFGLVGLDLNGKRRQYVFHRGQFGGEALFKDIRSILSIYK